MSLQTCASVGTRLTVDNEAEQIPGEEDNPHRYVFGKEEVPLHHEGAKSGERDGVEGQRGQVAATDGSLLHPAHSGQHRAHHQRHRHYHHPHLPRHRVGFRFHYDGSSL